LPTDCAASVWKITPRSWAMRAHASMGSIVPTSLFACITLTSTVRGVIARRRSSGSTSPAPSTGSTLTAAPRPSRNRHGATTEGCSTALITTCAPRSPAAKTTPFSARLFASLPPLVKTISSLRAPRRSATWARALATASRAGRPAQCGLEGFP